MQQCDMIAKIGYNPFPSGCRLISTGDTEQMAEPIKVDRMTQINCITIIMNVYVRKRLCNKTTLLPFFAWVNFGI